MDMLSAHEQDALKVNQSVCAIRSFGSECDARQVVQCKYTVHTVRKNISDLQCKVTT